MNQAAFWVEIIAALTVPLTFVTVVLHRVKSEMGMGYRAIQFMALGVVLPVILILSLERVIDAGVVGTAIGAVIGYIFSPAARATSNPKTALPKD